MRRSSLVLLSGIGCVVAGIALGYLAYLKQCEGMGCLGNRVAALPSVLVLSLGVLLLIAGGILKKTSKRFWKWFAAYYPASPEGWAVTLTLAVLLVAVFLKIDRASHSVSDTLIAFTPPAVIILLIFDLFCFRTGEYPSWWKRRG